MIQLTREVGAFVAGMRYEAIAPQALAMIRNGITDCAAVTILGRDTDVVRIVRSVLKVGAGASGVAGRCEARLLFGTERAGAPDAALVNGAAAHALDYDDIGMNGVQPTHPSAVLVPAILAEGEALARSGRDLIAAYATGFEVWGEIASRDKKPYHVKGWHPTATFGAVAAAAAAARLHGLDAERSSHAIAIACSQAGGVVANFGSMTKPFHAGRSASVGVLSARLAAAGMTASADALEHRQGWLNAMSPAGEVDLDTAPRFGKKSWLVAEGLGFKLYPMCYGTHRALDGAIALAREHDLDPQSVARIEVQSTQHQLANLVHHDPRSVLHAKFSMEFAMAMALVARRATNAELQMSFIERADVRALMNKVRISVVAESAPARDLADPGDGMIVTLKDGTRLERRFGLPLGHPRRPAPPEALWTKFADCTRGALDEAGARRLFEALQNLERLGSLAELPVVAN
jgi:2-methylcitrate dehydratase PrpD